MAKAVESIKKCFNYVIIILIQNAAYDTAIAGTAQKIQFSIKDFFSKCDQIHNFLRIWPHLLKKSLMENFLFCSVLAMRMWGSFS